VVRRVQYGRQWHELRVRIIPTMFGHREGDGRVVFTRPALVAPKFS
jgi:hypothetical protein